MCQSLACYMLLSQKDKRVVDYLLLHLCGMELGFVLFSGFYTARAIILHQHMFENSKLKLIGFTLFGIGLMSSIILVTLDRVFAVMLTIKYRVVITKKRMLIVFVLCWVSCISHVIIVYLFPSATYLIHSTWDIFVTITILVGYGYIIVKTRCMSRNLAALNQQRPRTTVKLTVPSLIITTFVLLCLIPDLLLAMGIPYSLWILSSYNLNFMMDSLIYILATGRFRSRLQKMFHRNTAVPPDIATSTV